MATPEKFTTFMRNSTACVLLSAAFFALPLAFLRLGGQKIPFYGMVEAMTLPAAGMIMTAAVLLFADWKIYRNDRRWQLLGAAQCAIMAVACRHASFSGAAATAFYVFAPTAGAALQRELKRFLPFFAALWALLLLTSGIASENFTGLCGNWNWTQALLAALLPGIPLLLELRCRKSAAILLLLLCSGVIWYNYPLQFSRIILPAAALSGIAIYCTDRFEAMRKTVIYAAIFLIAAALFFSVLYFADWHDSRFQLWKGAFFLAAAELPAGVGMGNFGSAVLPFIPERYFFTPFAAPWHPHPHNELLNFLCAYGIAGGFYIFALATAVFKRRAADSRGMFAQWIFLYLLICGMFDMSCAVVAGAWWCFLSAGIGIAGTPQTVKVSLRRLIPAAILLGMAAWQIKGSVISTVNLRRGEIALLKRDTAAARRYLRQSSTPLAKYHLAEMELLLFNDPQYVRDFYRGEKAVFLHSNRLLAISLMREGQHDAALAALRDEISCYPYSVINARLYWVMLKISGAPASEYSEAYNRFLHLCRLRNISPAKAAGLKSDQDDLPLSRVP